MDSKTHYRKVHKSDHLGTPDLEEMIEEGKPLIFTISYVRQEKGAKVAGRKIDANIAYFNEGIKPLVLNVTNSKVLKSFTQSPFVEDWSGVTIELFIDPTVKMKGEVVGGVRISPTRPKKETVKPIFTESNFEKAKQANATIEMIKSRYSISKENEAKYLEYVK